MSVICQEGRCKPQAQGSLQAKRAGRAAGNGPPGGSHCPGGQRPRRGAMWACGQGPSWPGPSLFKAQLWSWFNVAHSVLVHLTAPSLAVFCVNRPGHAYISNPPPFPSSSPATATPAPLCLFTAHNSLHTHTSPATRASFGSWNTGVLLPNRLRPGTFPCWAPRPTIAGPSCHSLAAPSKVDGPPSLQHAAL